MTLPGFGGMDLVQFGARSGLLWRGQGRVLAGLGVARTITIHRPHGALAAQATLAELQGPNALPEVAGTGPVGFAAMAFDPKTPGTLIIPEILLGEDEQGQRWLSITSDGPPNPEAVLANIMTVDRRPLTAPGPHATWKLSSVLAPDQWRDQIVATVRDSIRADGQLNKVVLAREAAFEQSVPINVARVLTTAADRFPSANLFRVNGFIGASPELLVSRNATVVQAHPLAGTAPRYSDPAQDAASADRLQHSLKDRGEHQITIDWFLRELLPFCSYVDAEPEPSVVTIANVHHLGTLVEGVLSSPPASVLELVAATHPTPAVGGDPQDVALQMIATHERAERGRYAGPTGWVDAAGNGAFAVSVRSAEITDNRASVFAGVGVVADSDPQAELDETRSKFQAMLGPLLSPWPDAEQAIADL